jgi:hypothetical protein
MCRAAGTEKGTRVLSIFDAERPINRRRLLSIGSLGLGGLSLASLLAVRAQAKQSQNLVTGKSVIFLFQQGGPSQLETFDPKVNAPSGIRTVTDVIQTKLPGVTFGETMSKLAGLADKLTVVRSFQTNNGGHNIRPIVGPDSLETNIGSHYARIAGVTQPASGMPTNTVLFPQAVCPDVTKGRARGNLSATGSYGSGFSPFTPGGKGDLQQDMKLNLPHDRFFGDRRELLSQLDRLNRKVDASGQLQTMDELQQQAYQLLLGGGVAEALDLSNEDPAVVARYDTGRFVPSHNWERAARGKRGYYTGNAKSIGKLLLLSRRLCEAGCGFVTIHAGYDGVWDMHGDGNNLHMIDGMQAVGRPFDHAVATFIEDIEARGLQDKIMLVACGEMGRTPRINKRGGRDHWSRLAPLLIYGGGTKGGRVIGQSTRDGAEPARDNLTPKNLIATIMHTLFDYGELRIMPGLPSEVAQVSGESPIPGLF